MRKLIPALLVTFILLTALPLTLDAQGTYQVFENIRARTLTTLGNATIGADLAVTDDVTADGITAASLNLTGNATADNVIAGGYIAGQGALYLIPGASITVTDGGTITPTTAVQELTAAGNVGADLAACGDGQVQTFVNLSNVTITITDTGTVHLAGNAALGQYDSLTVVGSGVRCIEVARANN